MRSCQCHLHHLLHAIWSQALSKAEGGTKNELSSLEAEADMPLEQLLAQYGYVMPNGTASSTAGAPSGSLPTDAGASTSRQQRRKAKGQPSSADRPAKRQRTSPDRARTDETTATGSDGTPPQAHSLDNNASTGHVSGSAVRAASGSVSALESDGSSADLRSLMEMASEQTGADTSLELHTRNGPAANRPIALGALAQSQSQQGDEVHSGSDFDSAGAGSADDDDEQTLEEEERMAQAEGNGHNVSHEWLMH